MIFNCWCYLDFDTIKDFLLCNDIYTLNIEKCTYTVKLAEKRDLGMACFGKGAPRPTSLHGELTYIPET